MTQPSNCPECGALLLTRGGCRECDWKPPSPVASASYLRCDWRTEGRVCLAPPTLLGTPMNPHPPSCFWHDLVREDPAHANAFEELERVQDWHLEHAYCGWLTHFTPTVLWAWLRGIDMEARPQPCLKTSCAVRALEDAKWLDPIPGYRYRPCPKCEGEWTERRTRDTCSRWRQHGWVGPEPMRQAFAAFCERIDQRRGSPAAALTAFVRVAESIAGSKAVPAVKAEELALEADPEEPAWIREDA